MRFLRDWRILWRLGAAMVVTLALSCGGGGGGDVAVPPPASLRVYNDGSLTMFHLYVTPSSSSTWGVDQLGSSSLYAGSSITLTNMFPDYYDVEARFSDGSIDTVFDVQVVPGGTTGVHMANTGNGSVAVVNNSGHTITGIFLTLSTATTWGPNQTDTPLYSGQTLTLTGVSPGVYDLRVVFSDGTHVDQNSLTVNSGFTTTIQVN